MKTTHSLISFSLALMLITSPAFSQSGNSAGGGGTVLILKDDTVVMADAYFEDTLLDSSDGKLIHLGVPLIEEILRAKDLMIVQSGYFSGINWTTFFEDNIFSNKTTYILVDEIPTHCPYVTPVLKDIPEGARIEKVACTDGPDTYLVKSIFEKMSLREQALQIIHERLRAEPVSLTHKREMPGILKAIYVGLSTGLKRLDQEVKGDFTPLNETDLSNLEKMATTIEKYKLLKLPAPEAHPDTDLAHYRSGYWGNHQNRKRNLNGGGFILSQAQVDDSAYIGLSTIVGYDPGTWASPTRSYVGKNAVLASPRYLNCIDCKIEEDAQLYGNVIYITNEFTKIHLAKGAKVIRNRFHDLQVEEGDTQIRNYQISVDLIASENTSIVDSNLEYSAHKGNPAYFLFNVKSGVNLNEAHLTLDFNRARQRSLGLFTWPAYIPLGGAGFATFFITIPVEKYVNNTLYKILRYTPRITKGRIRIDLENLQGNVRCETSDFRKNKITLSDPSPYCLSKGATQ